MYIFKILCSCLIYQASFTSRALFRYFANYQNTEMPNWHTNAILINHNMFVAKIQLTSGSYSI